MPPGFDPFAGARPGPPPAGPPPPGAPYPGVPAPAPDAFGHVAAGPDAGLGTLTTEGPPLGWFGIALGLALMGLVLSLVGAFVGGMPATASAGWLLAGPIAIGALAMYNRIDTRRRSTAVYSAPTWAGLLYWVVLAACVVGIGVGAWQLALWAGRL